MRSARPRLAGASIAALGSFSMVVPLMAGLPASGVTASGVPARGGLTALESRGAAMPVAPEVREVSVPETDRPQEPRLAATSVPQPVDGFGVVGATWLGRPPTGLRLAVRTQTRGSWSAWSQLHGGSCPCALCAAGRAAAEASAFGGHGPNASSSEARLARSGTDPLAVGEVGAVQLRATSATGRAPRDLQLSVIDPGQSAYDRPAALPAARAIGSTGAVASHTEGEAPGVRAPRPHIRTRSDWGADSRLRSGSPQYGQVEAAFVHHTVNSNDYSRSDVPAIIRGIYAYHTRSLGWSDIGYNFLVDRFGRKWAGRAGGMRRAVIGAQVYGYNHVSTGIATIGNFETTTPSREMMRGVGRVVGWKLGLHGVRVGGRYAQLDGDRFRAVSGHRDGGQTACPGINLYRRLDVIREIAIRRQGR